MPGLNLQDVISKAASHRDLSDEIAMVEATKFPMTSMLPKGTQSNDNILLEWPIDRYEDPKMNARAEQDITSYEKPFEKYGLASTRMQFAFRTFAVSDLAEDTQNLAGIKAKYAKALAKQLVHAKQDLEVDLGSTKEAAVGDGTDNNPDKSHSVGSYINASAQTVLPVPADHRPPSAQIYSGTLASLTETGTTSSVQVILESIFAVVRGASTRTLMCGIRLKAFFDQMSLVTPLASNTAIVRRFNQDAASKAVLNVVNTYTGSAGVIELVPTAYLGYTFDGDGNPSAASATNSLLFGYLMDFEKWELVFKRKPQEKALPDAGLGPRAMIRWQWALKCKNPRAEAAFKITS